MSGQASVNCTWSKLIFEELNRYGVEHVCVAPGSRSTPLILQADEHSKLELHSHFDERGLGFYALGLAKASGKPVAIVVTSGTAVANLLPAVAEAHLTGEKLILLTADRPVELIDCGANQAIEQRGIFSSHVSWALDLPSPSLSIAPNWLLTSLDQGLDVQRQQGGPIHINCAFPEPLYGEHALAWQHDYFRPITDWVAQCVPYTQHRSLPRQAVLLTPETAQKKGVVIIGNVAVEQARAAKALAQALGWPVLCDPQSGVSSQWAHYDLWLQNPEAKALLTECQVILQFGARMVSKRLNQFISEHAPQGEYLVILPRLERLNPNHVRMQTIVTDPLQWAKEQRNLLIDSSSAHQAWGSALARYSQAVSALILPLQSGPLTETALASQVLNWQLGDSEIFIGNSMIVRLIDMLAKDFSYPVHTNRGASGIDGLIATAAGTQVHSQQPLLVMLGDTSLLHDLNSLALLRDVTAPVVVVVTNNDGGAIFDMLPVPAEKKSALYQMPHGLGFEFAARQFGLKYLAPQRVDDCRQAVESHLAQGQGSLLVEIVTPPQQASDALVQLTQLVRDHASD